MVCLKIAPIEAVRVEQNIGNIKNVTPILLIRLTKLTILCLILNKFDLKYLFIFVN